MLFHFVLVTYISLFVVQNSWVYYRIWSTICHNENFSRSRQTSTSHLFIGLLSSLETYEVTLFEKLKDKDQIYEFNILSVNPLCLLVLKDNKNLLAWLCVFVYQFKTPFDSKNSDNFDAHQKDLIHWDWVAGSEKMMDARRLEKLACGHWTPENVVWRRQTPLWK